VARASDFINEDDKEPVYAVRFAARELWGEDASSNDTVLIDLWHHYLEPC
jgi:nitrile hydratase